MEIRVPQAGESVSRVMIGRWLKKEGDQVTLDEKLVELETDKATQDVLATATGRLVKIAKKEGESAQIGDVIAEIDPAAAGAKPSSPTAPTAEAQHQGAKPANPPSSASDPFVMPAAERLLNQNQLSPRDVQATGPGNRLLKEDVQRHQNNLESSKPAAARPGSVAGASSFTGHAGSGSTDMAIPAPKVPVANAPASLSVAPAVIERQEEVVEMSPLRESIAKRLVAAQQTAALVTTFNEVDMSSVMQLRKDLQETFLKKHGVKLGIMSFFVKAVIDALRLYPQVNAEVRGNQIVYKNYFDIGVAVGGGRGLVVPIIRNAEKLSFAEIEKQIAELAGRARENKLTLEELKGGTFTISNGGVFGSMLSTPIVNPPQSGILGLHATQDRPVARDGAVVIRPMMYVALTYDHRLVDGRESVGFLVRVKDCMENPTRMLVEV